MCALLRCLAKAGSGKGGQDFPSEERPPDSGPQGQPCGGRRRVAWGDREGWRGWGSREAGQRGFVDYQQNRGGCGEGCTVARLGSPGPPTSLYR